MTINAADLKRSALDEIRRRAANPPAMALDEAKDACRREASIAVASLRGLADQLRQLRELGAEEQARQLAATIQAAIPTEEELAAVVGAEGAAIVSAELRRAVEACGQ